MIEHAELVRPSMRHAASHVAALREGFRRGMQDVVTEGRIREIEADFAAYLAGITAQSGRIRLPSGKLVPKVPYSLLWLCEGDAFIGEVSIRHRLDAWLLEEGGHIGYGIRPSRQSRGYGKRILALALAECRRLRIGPVLVTCLDSNTASARIIETNGGRLENMIPDPSGRGSLRRYWITL